ncbi:MAG: EAL domain-containing protein, partial [Methylobacteriaceae bacterium]|nr:EAL domain-containing protein [Methylobacteriaceae bacterium]
RWRLGAAFALGAGIWSTHFIAMLAYDPGLIVGFDILLTLASLALAFALNAVAFLVFWQTRDRVTAPLVGGAIVALGIAAMHHLGMEGVRLPGRFVWDGTLLGWSFAIGTAFAIGGFLAVQRWPDRRGRLAGAGLLVLAICAIHFLGMAAAQAVPDPGAATGPGFDLPRAGLTAAIAGAMCIVIGCAAWSLAVDTRLARLQDEVMRVRAVSDAAVEGMVILSGGQVLEANTSFGALIGRDPRRLTGLPLRELLAAPDPEMLLIEAGAGSSNEPDVPVETAVRAADGGAIPVEVFRRYIDLPDGRHTLLAIRDLRPRLEAEEHIRRLAQHDALTGLRNRSGLESVIGSEIARAERYGTPFALLYLDLDGFKAINDVHGHPVGDVVLQAVARRLTEATRKSDIVFRLGGDEFLIFLPHADDAGTSAHLAARIIERVQEPIAVGDYRLSLGVSIGIAHYPAHGRTVEDLVKNADAALYRVKQEGRGAFRFFDNSLNEAVQERRLIEFELKTAVARGECRLVYQPQVETGNGRVRALEALLRWTNPKLGAVSPAKFIPVAEESGVIVPLGAWIIDEACREAASWRKPIAVAINLSALQFQAGNLVELVREALDRHGLPPERLELEVTETALMRDRRTAQVTLEALKALGVRLAIDDFGTGYSSLSYLQSFPFDTLKVDREFIANLGRERQADAIVNAIVKLAHELRLTVVAEGVETEGQRATVAALGCELVQGYLTGRPEPIELIGALVGRSRPEALATAA